MARTTAGLPAGTRLTDHVSLGVLTASFPIETVAEALMSTDRGSQRERSLPAHVMVYYAIALALYADVSTREVLRCLLEGVRWLGEATASAAAAGASEEQELDLALPGKSGISQARTRLGAAPMEALYRSAVGPVATEETPGSFYRGWRVMSMDGTTMDVSDTRANARHFGRPASPRGATRTGAFPQLRVVGLLETGTRVISGAQLGGYHTSEPALARDVLPALTGEMLCLADRGFLGFDLWSEAAATGAALLWRAAAKFRLPVLGELSDGSYLSELRWSAGCRSADRTPIPVRVVEYTLPGVSEAEERYRVVTNIIDVHPLRSWPRSTTSGGRWRMHSTSSRRT